MLTVDETIARAIAGNDTVAVLIASGIGARIVHCNHRSQALTSHVQDELLGLSLKDIAVLEEVDRVLTSYRELLQEKAVCSVLETSVKTQGGRPRRVTINFLRTMWKDKAAALLILQDIGEQRRVMNLAQTRADVLNDVGMGVMVLDCAGNILYAGDDLLGLLGRSKEDIIGHSLIGLLPAEAQSIFVERLAGIASGKDRGWLAGTIAILCGGDKAIQAGSYVVPVLDQKERPIGQICIVMDSATFGTVDIAAPKANASEGHHTPNMADMVRQLQVRFQSSQDELNRISKAMAEGETAAWQPDHAIEAPVEDSTTVTIKGSQEAKVRLEVRCLGMLSVSASGRSIQRWRSNRAKAIFALLIRQPQTSVTRDVLMDNIWPDHDPKSAANNLRLAMYDLRKTLNHFLDLDESFLSILHIHGGYMINLVIEPVIDTQEFERRWEQGKALERTGQTAGAIAKYKEADLLYRGDYLEDELYTEWTISRREALKDTYLMILNKLADYCLNSGDYEGCVGYCQKTLSKDPSREDIYRKLMISYGRLGQRNRALQWYESCQKVLMTELGASPDRETTALYERLQKYESV